MTKLFAGMLAAALSSCFAMLSHADEIVHTVDFPSGDAAWSIAFERSQPDTAKTASGKGAGSNKMLKVDIVRLGNLRRDNITWTNGLVTQYWWIADSPIVLFEPENGGPVHGMKQGYAVDNKFDASTFSWISKDTFVGMKPFKGKKCRYYETQVPGKGAEELVHLGAWIDDKTSRPVSWDKQGNVAIFTFDLPLPKDPLVIPEKFKSVYKKYADFYGLTQKPQP